MNVLELNDADRRFLQNVGIKVPEDAAWPLSDEKLTYDEALAVLGRAMKRGHCLRSDGTERKWFETSKEAAAFRDEHPNYFRDVVVFCGRCGFFHCSNPGWDVVRPWEILVDSVDDRLLRTLGGLAMAGFRFERLQLSETELCRLKPPVGYSYRDRCNLHVAALAGKPTQRKLRCLICEAHEVPYFWRWPVLLRGQFLRIF